MPSIKIATATIAQYIKQYANVNRKVLNCNVNVYVLQYMILQLASFLHICRPDDDS
jgi:hypothetical protein